MYHWSHNFFLAHQCQRLHWTFVITWSVVCCDTLPKLCQMTLPFKQDGHQGVWLVWNLWWNYSSSEILDGIKRNFNQKFPSKIVSVDPIKFPTRLLHSNTCTVVLLTNYPLHPRWDIRHQQFVAISLCNVLSLSHRKTHFLQLWCNCPPPCCSWSASFSLARCSV